MAQNLGYENVWLDKCKYEDAERVYYEGKAKEVQTPLAAEVGRAREWLTNIKNYIEEPSRETYEHHSQLNPVKLMEDQIRKFEKSIASFEQLLYGVLERVKKLEEISNSAKPTHALNLKDVPQVVSREDDDDVDLFGSDSEEEEAALQVRQKRLADYEAKKSKKPAVIAKSNIILDVKPWDDETNMKLMEEAVRAIQTEGLMWGAAKLVPLAYGIHKLQISCVVEDDRVSVDWLQEQIENIGDYVQSVDIAAFNKV